MYSEIISEVSSEKAVNKLLCSIRISSFVAKELSLNYANGKPLLMNLPTSV